MQIKAWAKRAGVPATTVAEALRHGRIAVAADGLDAADAERWLRERRQRAAHGQAMEATRATERRAAHLRYAAETKRLTREIDELKRSTVSQERTAAALVRAEARLQAALTSLPVICCAEAAEILQRPPADVYRVLRTFAEKLRADIAAASGH